MSKQIDLYELNKTRSNVVRLGNAINALEKRKIMYFNEITKIQKECPHSVGVKLREYNVEESWSEAYCLCCNAHFIGQSKNTQGFFENTIDFKDVNFERESLSEEVKVEIALEMFRQERANHPELSDAEIVAIINEQVKTTTVSVSGQEFTKSIGTKK